MSSHQDAIEKTSIPGTTASAVDSDVVELEPQEPVVDVEGGKNAGHHEGEASSPSASQDGGRWTPEPWYHALYHTTTSVLGVMALVALPSSFSYLGWIGGIILLVGSTTVSYTSGSLLIRLQQEEQKTYSDIADSIMGEGFAKKYIRPLQFLLFFQVGALSLLVLGQSIQALFGESAANVSSSAWIGISGAIFAVVCLIPTLSHMWQLSFVGAVSAVAGAIVLVIACGLSIAHGSQNDIHYGRPASLEASNPRLDYCMGIFMAFGVIVFAYGGHEVLPDVQTSLHQGDMDESHRAMIKGFRGAYCFIFPCYLLITTVGYGAFGSSVSDFVVDDMAPYVGNAFSVVIYILTILNTTALAAVYLQAYFTLIEDIFPCLGQHYSGRYNFKQLIVRLTVIGACTFVAIAIPFFGYLSALTGAVCFTPLTFVLPFVFWNRSKLAGTSKPWEIHMYWLLGFTFALLGILSAIGSVYLIVVESSTFTFFQ